MSSIYWLICGVGFILCHLWWMLAVEFKQARIDDAVAPADVDLHNDGNIWKYENLYKRIGARKRTAFIRWVVVSAVVLPVSFLLASGGVAGVLAAPLPTTTRTPTGTPTRTITPTPTRTLPPTIGAAWTYQPYSTVSPYTTGTPARTATPHIIYQYAPATVVVTRVVTSIVTRVYVATPGTPPATWTPWVVYVLVTATPTATPGETETPTPSASPTQSITPTATPTETPTLTETP